MKVGMLMSRAYVIKSLTNALDDLTTGPGDVRSRLLTANQHMRTLREGYFPDHLISDWRWIKHQLTRFGPIEGQGFSLGSVENTMCNIQNRTGVKIAKRISKIYWELSNNVKGS